VEIDVSQRDGTRDLPDLVQGRTITQSFVCGRDGLSRIDVKMSNKVGPNFRHVVFRLHEEARPETEIAAHRVFGWHVVDDGWLAVPVPAQQGSAGRRYVLTIESPDGIEGQAVSAKASAASAYADGVLTIDGVRQEGALCFQTYCRAPAIVAGDVQIGEDTLALRGGAPADATARTSPATQAAIDADQRQWEQTRYLATTISAGLDAIREQARADHAELLDLQRQTLHASAEKVIARSVRDNPAARALRRLRGKGKGGV
jgi:hypothetical protein